MRRVSRANSPYLVSIAYSGDRSPFSYHSRGVPDDQDFDSDPARVRALLAECRQRLSEHVRISVSAADSAIQHLLTIGLQLSAIEDGSDDPELRARIETAIQEANAAISDLRRMVFDLESGTDADS